MISQVLGEYSAFWAELNDPNKFSPRDMNKLRRAVEDGEACLVNAWRRPATVLRVTRAKRLEIDQVSPHVSSW